MIIKWESLPSDATGDMRIHMWRAKVIGGWLVKSLITTRTNEVESNSNRSRYNTHHEVENVTMVHVPDPAHIWDTAEELFFK
jgi:hypothetical protein